MKRRQNQRPNTQVLPKGLWIVATPIGNLTDLSSRAIQALSEANAILCEDTRRTGELLSALGIAAVENGQRKLIRVDAFSEKKDLGGLIIRLAEGESFAVVTDAGTPGVSDPGARLIDLAYEHGVRVTPVPGPSTVATLISISGFEETAFTFRGFFPRKTKEKAEELALIQAMRAASRVYVWFESPNRISETLDAIAETIPEAKIIVAKELTKIHERVFRGAVESVRESIRIEMTQNGALGEWCLAIYLNPPEAGGESKSSEWVKALQCLLDAGVSASVAARQVSQHFGAPKKIAYEMALELYGKKNVKRD